MCGNLLYVDHNYLIKDACPFYSFKLMHPDRFRKGDILSSSCCRAVLQPFDVLNRHMFVQRIRQNVWISCRKFRGISLMRSRNIAIFHNIVYILRDKGTCHVDVTS